jgi:hypothetical protein
LSGAVIERLSKVRIRGQELALAAESGPRADRPTPHRKGGKQR